MNQTEKKMMSYYCCWKGNSIEWVSSLYKSVRVRLGVIVIRSERAEREMLKCRSFLLLFSIVSSLWVILQPCTTLPLNSTEMHSHLLVLSYHVTSLCTEMQINISAGKQWIRIFVSCFELRLSPFMVCSLFSCISSTLSYSDHASFSWITQVTLD